MKTLPFSEAKDRLSRVIDDVADRDDVVMITRNGRPAAVVVSPEEYDSWQATIDILSDPALMAQFERSRRSMRRARTYSLEELFGR
ncbi:MAG: type II toxin-antitoxin system Phd/YefM family antitoxin [Chloroflexi bacterium]|nr:type II toxin-antitoxin system Phd/YefM family antitoxin [Chloroflexota bacterium]